MQKVNRGGFLKKNSYIILAIIFFVAGFLLMVLPAKADGMPAEDFSSYAE